MGGEVSQLLTGAAREWGSECVCTGRQLRLVLLLWILAVDFCCAGRRVHLSYADRGAARGSYVYEPNRNPPLLFPSGSTLIFLSQFLRRLMIPPRNRTSARLLRRCRTLSLRGTGGTFCRATILRSRWAPLFYYLLGLGGDTYAYPSIFLTYRAHCIRRAIHVCL